MTASEMGNHFPLLSYTLFLPLVLTILTEKDEIDVRIGISVLKE